MSGMLDFEYVDHHRGFSTTLRLNSEFFMKSDIQDKNKKEMKDIKMKLKENILDCDICLGNLFRRLVH